MSGVFTFATGNVSKVLGLPLYAVGRGLSLLVPRDPRRWVVGSAFGVSDGARALVETVRSRPDAPRITWLATNDDEAADAQRLGVDAVRRDSLTGFRATLRAGTVVVTHGFGDVSRYAVDGARVVQLWHGTPLKRLHLDTPAAMAFPILDRTALGRRLIGAMYRRGTRRIDLIPASSATAADRLASAFALDRSTVQVLGEPRTDVLFAGPTSEREASARRRLESAVGPLGDARVVLHAPTWRDGAVDPGIPDANDWRAIGRWLEARDLVLVVRPHPLGVGDWGRDDPRVKVLTPAAVSSLNDVLWSAAVLVTDYSSTAVDFAVTGRPTVFLAPDAADYTATRGLYEPYAATTGGQVAHTWSQVRDRIDAVLEDGPAREAAASAAAALAARYHAHTDGRSAERVADALLGPVDPTAPRTPAAPVRSTGPSAPDRWIVLFESYYGRNASCNPRAIDGEIARRCPDARRLWAVADEAVVVPVGAEAVVEGSPAWVRARDEARLLVINDWIRDRWRPRRGQFVLQTWHGTPLKRIALGRGRIDVRAAAAVVRQSTRWSAMLAQSPTAARVLRRAYAVRGPMWTTGYPRNDILVHGSADGIRAALGVEGRRVVLYAPTWRSQDLASAHLLDSAAVAEALGPEWVVLVRGHARTMVERPPTEAAGVLDVTRYPDVSDLMAVADVLVTDYSSVMFDFSATGRPMVFFVPDLADYERRERGFYWSLADRAPGPLVTTTQDCVAAILADDAERWADRYASWQRQFNPLDDGRAAARVVDRLVAAGALPAPATTE